MHPPLRALLLAVLLTGVLVVLAPSPATAQVAPLSARTECDDPTWNAKFGIYRGLYRPSLQLDRDLRYDHIHDISKRAKLAENTLYLYDALDTIVGNLTMESATDVVAGAAQTTGTAVGAVGDDVAGIVADQLLEWAALAAKPTPDALISYVVTNTLETAVGLYGTVGMNALIDEYRMISGADVALFEYYHHCGDQQGVQQALDLSRRFENAEGSMDFLSWVVTQHRFKEGLSTDQQQALARLLSRVVEGVNQTYQRLSSSEVAAGTPDLEPYVLDPTPNTARPGSRITVEFGVENEGDAAARSSRARLQLNESSDGVAAGDTVLATAEVSELAIGATNEFEKTVTLPSDLDAGTYYLWLTLDVNSEAGQRPADEANDQESTDLEIEHLTPDLVPSVVDLTPSSAHPGAEVMVEVDIENWGEGAAHPSTAEIRLSVDNERVTIEDRTLGTIEIPALAPDEELHTEKLVRLPTELRPDVYYYVWIILDVDSRAGQPFAAEQNDTRYEGISVDETQ